MGPKPGIILQRAMLVQWFLIKGAKLIEITFISKLKSKLFLVHICFISITYPTCVNYSMCKLNSIQLPHIPLYSKQTNFSLKI